MRAEVPVRVAGLLEVPGLRGSGGGALSGSELSHIGTTDARPESEKECWCLSGDSARSREPSRELDDMVSAGFRGSRIMFEECFEMSMRRSHSAASAGKVENAKACLRDYAALFVKGLRHRLRGRSEQIQMYNNSNSQPPKHR